MKALSTLNEAPEKASRPFDKERSGFVMAEGAGILVLETEEHALNRGAKIYAEFPGFGLTDDAFHITQPAPQGEGARKSMKQAIEDAKLTINDIDYHQCSSALPLLIMIKMRQRLLRIFLVQEHIRWQ